MGKKGNKVPPYSRSPNEYRRNDGNECPRSDGHHSEADVARITSGRQGRAESDELQTSCYFSTSSHKMLIKDKIFMVILHWRNLTDTNFTRRPRLTPSVVGGAASQDPRPQSALENWMGREVVGHPTERKACSL